MKSVKSNLLAIILIALLASSCISTKKIESLFSYYRPIVHYQLDNEIKLNKLPISVAIGEVRFDSLVRKKTSVTKKSGWIIPLVVVNVWKSKKICYQGLSSYYTPVENSFQYYLKKESSRSGIYQLDSLDADYELEIIIKKIEAIGPYKDVGYSFFSYGVEFKGTAGPALAEFVAVYQLKKNGAVIREEAFESNRKVEFIYQDYEDRKDLLKSYSSRMAEATSLNIKTIIEAMVVDLNSYFKELR